jgi:hypothetical protein
MNKPGAHYFAWLCIYKLTINYPMPYLLINVYYAKWLKLITTSKPCKYSTRKISKPCIYDSSQTMYQCINFPSSNVNFFEVSSNVNFLKGSSNVWYLDQQCMVFGWGYIFAAYTCPMCLMLPHIYLFKSHPTHITSAATTLLDKQTTAKGHCM